MLLRFVTEPAALWAGPRRDVGTALLGLDDVAALPGLLLPLLLLLPRPLSTCCGASPPASNLCNCRAGTALPGLFLALLGLLLLLLAVLPRLLTSLLLVPVLVMQPSAPVPADSEDEGCATTGCCTCRCSTSPGARIKLSASPGESCTGRCAASSTAAVVAALPAFQSCCRLTGGALKFCRCCCRSCCCLYLSCPKLVLYGCACWPP